MEEDKS